MEGTFVPVGVGGNHQEFSTGSPNDWLACLLESPVEDFLPDESGAGHAPSNPHSSGHTSNHSTAADAMEVNAAAGHGQGQPVPQLDADKLLDAHTEWDWTQIDQLDADRLLDAYWTPINPDLSQIHTTHAAAEDIPPVVNTGLTHPQPAPYSTGDTTRCASTAADMEVITAACLPQSGGGGLAEAAVRGSSKRKKLVRGSSSQRSTPPEFNMVELQAGLVRSDTSSTDIKPPAGSTDWEIIDFLMKEEGSFRLYEKEVNLSLGKLDEMVPMATRRYITTVPMMFYQKTHHGSWKHKDVKFVYHDLSNSSLSYCKGIKRTFQFHMYDGTKTNWFMHEYVPMDWWGDDLFMKHLRFREVYYEGVQVPGEDTSPEVKIKNKVAAVKKHRMRGPGDLVIKGESPAWEDFIKIYDRHPEQEGSKLVYAVCRHCEWVLKAGTDNGTKSLLTHCNRTCRIKNNKNQQASSLRAHLFRAVPDQE